MPWHAQLDCRKQLSPNGQCYLLWSSKGLSLARKRRLSE
jgi:hypothetical protein